ncbi:glutamine--fructose-6-phosphate transaminase (isomerizing) [bacterium]|jgi:glucosamine--fructose-6-phosphate aminotransferase (isomerizing)|nr:glutamine--fructose-6-phosphate transaminase (isomerizing) [bacterium]
MCGIVGYVGNRPAVDLLLKGLKRLEYRGYDSAGIAVFHQNKLEIKKSEGRLENVEKLLNGSAPLYKASTSGLGHTRWATHGKPTTQNAHPHRTGHVVLVHNGIIENYQEIRDDLATRGHHPASETDSEFFGFLVLEEMNQGSSLAEAVRKSFARLEGASSVVVMSEKEPGVVIGARGGSPLVAGLDPNGGAILASDAQPIMDYTRDVYFLDVGEMVVGSSKGLEFLDISSGKKVSRPSTHLDWQPETMDKQGYPHYMLKEIYEQPRVLVDTLNGVVDRATAECFELAEHPGVALLRNAKDLKFVACGTSWHAALMAKYWIERWGKVPVDVELASEFRYRDALVTPGSLVVAISQSGETADTLSVVRDMKKKGVPTLAVTNVRGSTMSREADAAFFTSAGPEIGVAATKTFFAQMLMVLLWAGFLAEKNQPGSTRKLFDDLVKLPHLLEEFIRPEGQMAAAVKKAAHAVQDSKGFFFIGRGTSFPIALEGALKLKEIAYVHAEGYAGGELKHGPIAMIDEQMTVVVLAPQDGWRDKTVSNLEEVKARGAKIVGIGGVADGPLKKLCHHWIPLPDKGVLEEGLAPFLLTPVMQLFSYELALLRGTDVDKPRNLAKSVTVE